MLTDPAHLTTKHIDLVEVIQPIDSIEASKNV